MQLIISALVRHGFQSSEKVTCKSWCLEVTNCQYRWREWMTLRPATPCEKSQCWGQNPASSIRQAVVWGLRRLGFQELGFGVWEWLSRGCRAWCGTLGSRVDQEVKPPGKKVGREWQHTAGEDWWVWIRQQAKLNEQVWEVGAWTILLEAVWLWLSRLQTVRSHQAGVYTLLDYMVPCASRSHAFLSLY